MGYRAYCKYKFKLRWFYYKSITDEEGLFNSGTTSKCYILRDNDICQIIKFQIKTQSSNKTFAMVGLSSEKEWINYVGTNPEGWSDMLKRH